MSTVVTLPIALLASRLTATSSDPIARAHRAAAAGFGAREWLSRCLSIGMDVSEHADGLLIVYGDSNPEERLFLESWINLTPGGNAAVLAILQGGDHPSAPAALQIAA